MKRVATLLLCIVLTISGFAALPAETAYAGDLSAWGYYYPESNAGSNGFLFNMEYGRVPHLNTTAVKYRLDTSCVTTSMMTSAAGSWGGLFSMTSVSSGQDITVKYEPNPTNTDAVAYVTGSFDYYTGHRTNATTLTVCNYFLPSPGNPLNMTQATQVWALSHEMGHLFGLGDMYKNYPNVKCAMSNDFASRPLPTRQELNAVRIAIGNPWYQRADGLWSYWSSPGVLSYQWRQIGSPWHYFGTSGIMWTNQWVSPYLPGNPCAYWAYVGYDGRALTDWQYLYDNGGYYYFYFDSAGNMQTGWLNWGGGRFYLKPSAGYPTTSVGTTGAMVTGWQWVQDTNGVEYWFYFKPAPSGRMVVGRAVPDSGGWCFVQSNGRAAQSIYVTVPGLSGTRYVDANYHLQLSQSDINAIIAYNAANPY